MDNNWEFGAVVGTSLTIVIIGLLYYIMTPSNISMRGCGNHTNPQHVAFTTDEIIECIEKYKCKGWHKIQ